MINYLDNFFESIVKDVNKKSKLAESVRKTTTLTEAKMSEIPHEIDDVVHNLAQSRIDMEHLRKTWEAAGFKDLTPLDEIIKGIVDLTVFVYNKGALLADQNIGSEVKPLVPLAVPATEGSDNALKEDDSIEQIEETNEDVSADVNNESSEESITEEDDNFSDNEEMLEEKEISLAECEALCANPVNASLRKAFKKCCSDFRHNRPEGSNGEIVKIILTPRNNLRLHFDGCDKPAFAYCDGESII